MDKIDLENATPDVINDSRSACIKPVKENQNKLDAETYQKYVEEFIQAYNRWEASNGQE